MYLEEPSVILEKRALGGFLSAVFIFPHYQESLKTDRKSFLVVVDFCDGQRIASEWIFQQFLRVARLDSFIKIDQSASLEFQIFTNSASIIS